MKPSKIKEILKKNRKDWEDLADKFSQTRHHLWYELKDLSQYVKTGDRVLDLGCGNGRLYMVFENRKVEYVGVDSSKRLIELGRKRFPQANFIVTSALDLPFKKQEFNTIFSIAFLHHLPSQKLRLKVLENCYSFLKQNGYLICSVWNLFQPRLIRKYRIWQILFGFKNVFIPFKFEDRKVQRYYHVFTNREFKKLFKKAGFEIVDTYYIKKGQKSNWRKGFNLVLIGQKND